MKRYIATLLLAYYMEGYTQGKEQAAFVPPLDFPLTLSGDFGEIRSSRFHSGLDFKMGGTIGKPARALTDEYVSHIRATNDSGYVLNACYHSGYSTIDRHLNTFLPPVTERVGELQYESENWGVGIIPKSDEYPVKAERRIALSGSTGYSFGPYLHLDVFKTETGDYTNPMSFFKENLKDTRASEAGGIVLFLQLDKEVASGSQENKATLSNSEHSAEAWRVIGIGIKTYDYMSGTDDHCGVYSVVPIVGGTETFHSTVDRSSQEESRMVNSWAYGQYMGSFIDPGDALQSLRALNDNRGLVMIDEERDYQFQYILGNAFGNTSRYHSMVCGKRQPIRPLSHREKYFFAWDETNYLQEPRLSLVVPKGMLYDSVLLQYRIKVGGGAVVFTYQLNDKPVPLHVNYELRTGLRRKPVADTTRYYVVRAIPKGTKYNVEGKHGDGFMKASVRGLDAYTVVLDTVPPEITPASKNLWRQNGKIVYRLKNEGTDITSYRETIDGKYALFDHPNIVKSYWECVFDPRHVKKGSKYIVGMTITDACGNQTVPEEAFI